MSCLGDVKGRFTCFLLCSNLESGHALGPDDGMRALVYGVESLPGLLYST